MEDSSTRYSSEIASEIRALRRYKDDAKLRDKQKVFVGKQSEICDMKTLNTFLTNELEQTKKFPTKDELKDKFKNVKCYLKMSMDDNKRLENDLCQMKQLLEENDKINQMSEDKISRVEIELKNCEVLKRSCEENYNNLSIHYSNLQLDLATEKKENHEKVKRIDDLCDKMHYFKDVITGLHSQILLNEEEANARIDDLTTEKNRVSCEYKQLKNDIVKLCKYTELSRYKQANMESKFTKIEADKSKLARNIDNLKEELKCTLKNEIEMEKNLSVAYMEIKSLKLSIKCYEKTVESERQKLIHAEQRLQDTSKAQLSMLGWNHECLTCIDTEIPLDPIEWHPPTSLSSRHDELLLKNEELAKINGLLGEKIACLEESVQKLQCANNDLTETINNSDAETKIRWCHAESMAHFDQQTVPCPAVECPHDDLQTDTCPHVCDCSCDSPCDCDGTSDDKGCEPAVSSDSVTDCAGGVVEVCDSSTTSCDLLETNRLLRCELDEMKQSCEQNEADMVRRRLEMEWEVTRCRDEIESLKRSCERNGADTERRRCERELEVKRYRDEIESLKRSCEQNEEDMKLRRCEMEWKLMNCRKEIESQTASRMAELTAQLETNVALVARLKKDCHNQINQLKQDSAEFEKTREIQEQLKNENELKESFENKSAFNHRVETTVQKDVSSKKDRNDDLNHENKSNGKKFACKKKKKKPEKKVTKKPFSYGPRINLPCCIGSENRCKRPQLVEKLNNRRATMQNLQAPKTVDPSINQHRRQAAGGNSQQSSVMKCSMLSKEMIALMSKELDKRVYAFNANKSRSTKIK